MITPGGRVFRCRICNGEQYTGPFLGFLCECDECGNVFTDPDKWTHQNIWEEEQNASNNKNISTPLVEFQD